MSDADRDRAGRDAAQRAAELLARPEGLRLVRLLARLGLEPQVAPDAAAPAAPAPDASGPRPIGIWQPAQVDGRPAFVRAPSDVIGDPWCPTRVLSADRPASTIRVTLIGESVATGWTYAPEVTPAKLLAHQLATCDERRRYLVDDLTRVDLDGATLVELVAAARQLVPDVIVIFAGNNWPQLLRLAGPSVQRAQRIAGALRAGGDVGDLFHGLARQNADRLLKRIAGAAAGIRTILVIPELNLLDWQRALPPVQLAGDGVVRRWYEVQDRVLAADPGGPERLALAAELSRLDHGSCPRSRRLLGEALIAGGDLAAAEPHLRAEVDAAAATWWLAVPTIFRPGLSSEIAASLEQAAEDHGLGCVKLVDIFAAHTGAPLQGRRLFLDYCHLSLEGMQVAMAATAEQVLRVSGAAEVADWGTVLRRASPEVPRRVDAIAKFLAAVNYQHWEVRVGGSSPLVRHWLEEAMRADPGIVDLLADYVRMRAVPAAAWGISAAQQRVHASTQDGIRSRFRKWRALDPELVTQILAILAERDPAGAEDLRRSLFAAIALDAQPRTLLGGFHAWSVADLDRPSGLVYRALSPTSRFCAPLSEARALRLELTARGEGDAAVRVNGHLVQRFTLGPTWARVRCEVSSDRMAAGFNLVEVAWPLPAADGDRVLDELCARLELGLDEQCLPVFGELLCLDGSVA